MKKLSQRARQYIEDAIENADDDDEEEDGPYIRAIAELEELLEEDSKLP